MSETLVPFIAVHVVWTLWPVTYLWLHPFSVLAYQIALDMSNFSAWQISGTPRAVYNYADRGTDLWFYVWSLAYLWYWRRELWYARWTIPFIAFRIVGNIVYLATFDEQWLLAAPNVFEFLFLAYTLLDVLRLDRYVRRRAWLHGLVLAVAVAAKIGFEVVMHGVVRADEMEPDPAFPNIWNRFDSRIDVLVWLLLFVVVLGAVRWPSFVPGTVTRNYAGMFAKDRTRASEAQLSRK